MAAVISFCGIWMPTSAQDLVTKKAAPKTKLINVKKAPFANNLKNSHAVDDKKPVVKTHVPGIPFAEASGWKSVAMMPVQHL